MKFKAVLFIFVVATASQVSLSGTSSYLKMEDGSSVRILKGNITTSQYVSEAKQGEDGKTIIVTSEYSIGEALVEVAPKNCLKVSLELIELKTVQSGNLSIQVPAIKGTSRLADCKTSG